MKRNFKKIIVLFIITLISVFVVNHKVDASTLSFKVSNNNPGINEQFYVDLMLDTEGKIINGIEGYIEFSNNNISFIRAEEGGSMVNFWIQKPKINGNRIELSGIIPNGFNGIIDPFNQSKKLSGLIIRLVFEAKKEGESGIISTNFFTTLNDGLGTVENIQNSKANISIKNIINPYIYKTEGDTKPELSAFVVRDPNLYDNKYVLVYDAKDMKTGIKEVLVQEGHRPWVRATESPYLLEDQSRHSMINIQAINYSGSSTTMSIEGLPYTLFSIRNIFIAVFIFILLLFIIKKIYEKYKKIHN